MKKKVLKTILSTVLILGGVFTNVVTCYASEITSVSVNNDSDTLSKLEEYEEKYGVEFVSENGEEIIDTQYLEDIDVNNLEGLDSIISDALNDYEEVIDLPAETYYLENESFNPYARSSVSSLSTYSYPYTGLGIKLSVSGSYVTRAGVNYWTSANSCSVTEYTNNGFYRLGQVNSCSAYLSSSKCIRMNYNYQVKHYITAAGLHQLGIKVYLGSTTVNGSAYFYTSRI